MREGSERRQQTKTARGETSTSDLSKSPCEACDRLYAGGRPQTSKTWNTKNIRCPFFKRHSKAEIRCEGIMERTTFALIFEKEPDKKFYQKTYCEGKYECCEHYLMLMAYKYNDGVEEDGDI